MRTPFFIYRTHRSCALCRRRPSGHKSRLQEQSSRVVRSEFSIEHHAKIDEQIDEHSPINESEA